MKSAKFGGKLSVFKKVARNAQMTSSEFAKTSEREFSAMMSTLRSSYVQKSAKVRKIEPKEKNISMLDVPELSPFLLHLFKTDSLLFQSMLKYILYHFPC